MNNEDEPRDPAKLLPFIKEIVIQPGEVIPKNLVFNELPSLGTLKPKKAKRRLAVSYSEE